MSFKISLVVFIAMVMGSHSLMGKPAKRWIDYSNCGPQITSTQGGNCTYSRQPFWTNAVRWYGNSCDCVQEPESWVYNPTVWDQAACNTNQPTVDNYTAEILASATLTNNCQTPVTLSYWIYRTCIDDLSAPPCSDSGEPLPDGSSLPTASLTSEQPSPLNVKFTVTLTGGSSPYGPPYTGVAITPGNFGVTINAATGIGTVTIPASALASPQTYCVSIQGREIPNSCSSFTFRGTSAQVASCSMGPFLPTGLSNASTTITAALIGGTISFSGQVRIYEVGTGTAPLVTAPISGMGTAAVTTINVPGLSSGHQYYARIGNINCTPIRVFTAPPPIHVDACSMSDISPMGTPGVATTIVSATTSELAPRPVRI